MREELDWSFAEKHMWSRHRVLVRWAKEAVGDPRRLTFDPDPASRSGSSIRFIGYSAQAEALLAVIVVRFDGRLFAASAWKANDIQARGYREGDCDHE
jgi:hypothetical protein